jgi:predicted nucleic acid-binding Zn ribbon protein
VERLGETVRRLTPGSPLPEAAALGAVTSVWPGAVGEAIARHAWPARFARDGTLHVFTTSSVWAFELTTLAADIAAKLRAELGADAPPGLRFAPGPVPAPAAGRPATAAAGPPPPSAADRAAAAAIAAALADDELRETVARAAAASLATARSDRRF